MRGLLVLVLLLGACQRAAPTGPPATLGGLAYVVEVTGGADPALELPLVVAVHRMGSTPQHFSGLYAKFDGKARIVLPEAPEPRGKGFSWFPYRVGENDPPGLALRITSAEFRLMDFLNTADDAWPTTGKPVLTGFSQGGMLSYAVSALHPDLISAALPVGGLLPAPFAIPATGGAPRPPIRAFHGEADDVVSVDGARDTVRRFQEAGYDASIATFPQIPHSVGGDLAQEYFVALREALPSQP